MKFFGPSLLVLLAALAFPLCGEPAASIDPSARIVSLNARILGYYEPGDHLQFSRPGLREILRLRSGLLEQLIAIDPDRALSLVLSEETLSRLVARSPAMISTLELRGSWDGPATTWIEDGKGFRTSRTRLVLHTDQGDINVYPSRIAPLPPASSAYRVFGIRVGAAIAATKLVPLAAAGTDTTCDTVGDQKTAVVLTQVPGSPDLAYSVEQIKSWFFGPTGPSLDGYWREASYGKTSASGDVIGPLTLDQAYLCDQSLQLQNAVLQAALSRGIDLSLYKRVFIVLPSLQGGCFFDGLSTLGCTSLAYGSQTLQASLAWVLTDVATQSDPNYYPRVIAHEAGHGLGLNHSVSEACLLVPIGPPGDNSCTVYQYGDRFSAMGAGLGHYAASQKYYLGWLSDSDIFTVEGTANFYLAPLSSAGNAPKAARIRRQPGANNWFWLETRQNTGIYESTLFDIPFNGAIVRYEGTAPSSSVLDLSGSHLLDMTPPYTGGPGDALDAPLAIGNTWTDVFSGVSIGVSSATGPGVNVTVARDNACVTLNPLLVSYPGIGASDSVAVWAASGCIWQAAVSDSWIVLDSGSSGSGNGTVNFHVVPNNTGKIRQALLTIGGRAVLVTQASTAVPPQIVGATPAASTGAWTHIILNISDANGPAAIATVLFNITTGPPDTPGCMVSWSSASRMFRLMTDDGITWSSPAAEVDPNLQNSRCRLLTGLGEWLGQPGNEYLGLDVQLALTNGTVPIQTIYLRAIDESGNDTGWKQVGTWMPAPNHPPDPPAMVNPSGAGPQYLFVINITDPDGAADIRTAEFDIGFGSQICSVVYHEDDFHNPANDNISFTNTDGTIGRWILGYANLVKNQYCSLDVQRTTVVRSGNLFRLTVPLTFQPGFSGDLPVRLIASDWPGFLAQSTPNFTVPTAVPVISLAGVTNAASLAGGPVAPGEMVKIFGSGLGPPNLQLSQFVSGALQDDVAGTAVFFNGQRAPLISSSSGAVTAIVPYSSDNLMTLTLSYQGKMSNAVQVPIAAGAPGLFFVAGSSQISAFNQDWSANRDNPSHPGSLVTVFVTGEGFERCDSLGTPCDAGVMPPISPSPSPNLPVELRLGGIQIVPTFAGLVYPGVMQVNFRVPSTVGVSDAVPLQISVGDFLSPPGFTMRVR